MNQLYKIVFCFFIFPYSGLGVLFLCPNLKAQTPPDSLLSAISSIKNPKEQVYQLNQQGEALLNQNPALAIRWANQAKKIAHNQGLSKQELIALQILGEGFHVLGETERSRQSFSQALKIARDLKQAPLLLKSLNQLSLLLAKENPKEAGALLEEALEVARKSKSNAVIIEQNLVLASFYRQLDQSKKALEYGRRALLLSRKNRQNLFYNRSNLIVAQLYNDQEFYSLGLEYARSAQENLLENKNHFLLTKTYWEFARAYSGREAWEEAQNTLEEALKEAKELGSEQELAIIYRELSLISEKRGRIKSSLKYQRKYQTLQDSIHSQEKEMQRTRLATLLELDKKKQEIETLTNFSSSQEAEILWQRYLRNAFIFFSILILSIAFVLFRVNRQKALINQRLIQQNEAIEQQKQEISLQREEIAEKHEQLKEQNQEIVEKNTLIQDKNQDLTDSIEYAQRIQSAMLPTQEQIDSVLPESFIFYQPKDVVSGDFYWLHELDEKIIFSAVDCTGHGVPGAFMSLIANQLLNDIVVQAGILNTCEILNHLHQRVRFALNQRETDNKDGMDIALCVLDKKTRVLQFSGAYNPVILYQNGEKEIIKGDSNPIGGWHSRGDSREFTYKERQLEKGSMIYLFSDGFQDQFGGPQGRKMMRSRFYNLLDEIQGEEVSLQKKRVQSALDDWMQDYPQIDDVLVMGVRVT